MHFIKELPESESLHAILVVIGQLSKVQHYIPAQITWTAEDITDSYIHDIWKPCGPLTHMTLDCSPQFALKFLQELN